MVRLCVVQEVFGLCAVPSGTEADELQARKERRERVRKMLKIILQLEEGRMPDRNAQGWKVEGKNEQSLGKSVRG